jgi:Na+/melibiose symporter-like transporter
MFGIIQASMLADVVEHSELSTGRREEGLFFAAQTFINQATTGVGTFIAGLALTWIQFPTNAAPGTLPEGIVFNLGLVVGPSLMGFYLLALGAIAFYRISRDGHNQNVDTLRARAKEGDSAAREVEPAVARSA